MASANAVWKSHVSRHRRPATRRPKSGTVSTQNAGIRLGGGANAVAGTTIANSTSQGRTFRGGRVV